MWKQILYLSWLVAAGCSDIADREYPEPQPAPAATTDSQATVQTRNLLGNLRSIAENGGTLSDTSVRRSTVSAGRAMSTART